MNNGCFINNHNDAKLKRLIDTVISKVIALILVTLLSNQLLAEEQSTSQETQILQNELTTSKNDEWNLAGFMNALRDSDDEVAILALERVRNPIKKMALDSNRDAIHQLLNNPSQLNVKLAYSVLKSYTNTWGKPDIEVLTALTKADPLNIRIAAAEALANLGDKQGIDALLKVLADKDARLDVRQAVAEVLANLDEKQGIYALINALADKEEDPGVRQSAAKALGKLGDKQASDTLIKVLTDKGFNR